MEKAQRYEAETLANLELRREQVCAVLQDEQRIQLNERVAKGYLSKLEDAINVNEQSVASLFTALEEDQDEKQVFTEKLTNQMKVIDPLLDKLYIVLDSFKAAILPPPAVTDKSSKNLTAIQLKIRLAQRSIETQLNLVQDAKKQEATLSSLP